MVTLSNHQTPQSDISLNSVLNNTKIRKTKYVTDGVTAYLQQDILQ